MVWEFIFKSCVCWNRSSACVSVVSKIEFLSDEFYGQRLELNGCRLASNCRTYDPSCLPTELVYAPVFAYADTCINTYTHIYIYMYNIYIYIYILYYIHVYTSHHILIR